MQIARLYLRGSLVNYTGKNLNGDQQHNIDDLFARVDGDPQILPSKSKFIQKLSLTIGGEYERAGAAELEWWTATWRALLSATYHIPLEYRSFGSSNVNDKRAKRKGILYDGDVIDLNDDISIVVSESLPIPPCHELHICSKTFDQKIITNPRGLLTNPNSETRYVVRRGDTFVYGPAAPGTKSHRTELAGDFGELRETILQGDTVEIIEGPDTGLTATIDKVCVDRLLLEGPRPVIIGSDIKVMKAAYNKVMRDSYFEAQGEPQYFIFPALRPVHMIVRSRRANPSIIFDDNQLRKLVKNYGWEFIGQILKENKRSMIKTQIHYEDNADIVALKLLESIFVNSKESIKFEIDKTSACIKTETYLLPMSVVTKIGEIKREFMEFNVSIVVVENEGIYVKQIGDTPTITRKITEVRFHKMKSFDDKVNDDDDKSIRESLESQMANKERLLAHFESVHNKDSMHALLERLPDRAADFISMVISPPPELNEQYGPSPRERDIAVFMGVPPNDIKRFKATIKLQMMALNMAPGIFGSQI
jgi:hypothetical protein